MLVLSHHCPVDNNGELEEFGKNVLSCFGATKFYQNQTILWYFGHTHGAAIYDKTNYEYKFNNETVNISFLPRLCGHGGIPWADATAVFGDNTKVKWFEKERYLPEVKKLPAQNGKLHKNQVVNGYAFLALLPDGKFEECFYSYSGVPTSNPSFNKDFLNEFKVASKDLSLKIEQGHDI